MSSQAIVLRTHYYDESCKSLLRFLEKSLGFDIIIAADETKFNVDVDKWPKVSLTYDSLSSLGLYLPEETPWLCGDYFLYLVRQQFPQYDYYWMLEPDVYFNMPSPEGFFRKVSSCSFDYFVMHFSKKDESWPFYKRVKPFCSEVYGGPFPIVRLSARAIDYLLQERKEMSKLNWEGKKYPNDESFTASFLMKGGYSCSDFNTVCDGQVFATKKSFSTRDPWFVGELESNAPDGLIYHPAVDYNTYVAKIKRHVERGRELKQRSRDTIDKYFSDVEGL